MFVTIRSYNSCEKVDYIKYRLERAGIECKIVPQGENNPASTLNYKIEVLNDQVEKAVEELLKVHTEYPKENFVLKTAPTDLLHILIPIDFSDKSIEACKYALDIAANRPVEIKFLHIWNDELDDSIAVRNSHMLEDFKRIQRKELKRDINSNLDEFKLKLRQLLEETNTKNNLLYHFTIIEGLMQKQIEKTVYHYKPQLVIVGHNTNNEYKFRISRDIAHHIIDMAYCPVYYIPQKVYYTPLKELHVMYATNFNKNDVQSFNTLQKLSIGYEMHIHCMHVTYENSDKNTDKLMKNLIDEFDKVKTRELKISSDILSDSNLIKGFESYIKKNKIDMISFTSPEHGIWHKLFNPDNLVKIMKGTTLPLLIFRYKEN